MNEIQVTVRGNVTSEPRHVRFDDGNTVTSFRVASNARRYDAQLREWVSAGTTFMNVNCRRGLASNAANSLSKGQPVLVTGKLRERSWEKNGRSGRSLEIEADGLGHDLAWGTTAFTRVIRTEQLSGPADSQGDTTAYVASLDNHDPVNGSGAGSSGGDGVTSTGLATELNDADFDDDDAPDDDPDDDLIGALDGAGGQEQRVAAPV